MTTIITLLVLFNVAHFIGSFTPLSTPSMLKAKINGTPLIKIWYHALIHGFLFFLVIFAHFGLVTALEFFLIQPILHFVIDGFKSKISNKWELFKDMNGYPYWALFGIDQFFHQMVIVYITVKLCYVG